MKNSDIKTSKSYRIALFGVLSAAAIALSFVEGLLPTTGFLPPGAKPGFSNIVTMLAASAMGILPAAAITLVKALFAGVTRGATAFLMSFCGGMLSTAVMYLLFRYTKRVGCMGVGVLSAVSHNAGQLLVCTLLVGNAAVLGYIPVLLTAAVVTGAVTGAVLRAILPYITNRKTKKEEHK